MDYGLVSNHCSFFRGRDTNFVIDFCNGLYYNTEIYKSCANPLLRIVHTVLRFQVSLRYTNQSSLKAPSLTRHSRQYDPAPSPNKTENGTPIPAYKGEAIDSWFAPYGKFDLLAYMNKYWINQVDKNWVLWAHEFSKHATCYSTFQKECWVRSIFKNHHRQSY